MTSHNWHILLRLTPVNSESTSASTRVDGSRRARFPDPHHKVYYGNHPEDGIVTEHVALSIVLRESTCSQDS
jgi:hypothetical protein